MAVFGKWVDGISADDPAREAAREAVRVRVTAVRHYLLLVKKRVSKDPEIVHQLRVCSRRAAAALKLFADILSKRDVRWLKKQLRTIRRAAGDARDLDVLLETQLTDQGKHAEALRKKLHQRRKKAQKPMVRTAARMLKHDRLLARAEQLRNKPHPRPQANGAPVPEPSFGEWARDHLREVTEAFFGAAPSACADPEVLHQFRIRGKELRYAMELLAPAFPAAFREQLYPQIEQLQDRLGKINDQVVAIERIRGWLRATSKKGRIAYLRAQLTHEQETLAERREEFLQWWTPEMADGLRADFEQFLSPNHPSPMNEPAPITGP